MRVNTHVSSTQHTCLLLQERQPFYNHLEWERERLQNEKYLRNISQVGARDRIYHRKLSKMLHILL